MNKQWPAQVIGIASGKGGVGKTTVSVNLAVALAAKGKRVMLFDADLGLALARDAGFATAQHVSADDLAARYFANRPDGLRPPANAEELLVAGT